MIFTFMNRQIHTIAFAYREICEGQMPWVALGNFMNEWFDYSIDAREFLVTEDLPMPMMETQKTIQWAAFCAASVEFLCEKYQIDCPNWPFNPKYYLSEVWFSDPVPGLVNPKVQEYIIGSTPQPYIRRNIYCGGRVFANKYDFARHMRTLENRT
jgi:hypothetical protein